MEPKIKAVIYARCSTLLSQDPGLQIATAKEFAQRRGFDVVESYVDYGISGVKEKRPALDKLIIDARKGKFNTVICTALDRLARSSVHMLTLMADFHSMNIKLISLRENIDFSSPMGQMSLTIISAVAQLEREIIRERIKSSLAAKKLISASTGVAWSCGRPTKKKPDVVAEIIKLAMKGLSVRAIERMMSRRVSRSTIHRVIIENAQK